ncbi:MAG TPA: hypothetical protein PK619_02700 [bacterium]|nr:hypothetical protein [bacterium]HPW39605.1 hypothetical protein [bacterium]
MTNSNLPTRHIVAENIPQALWRAIKTVWTDGLPMRTQYDRRNEAGQYIDPPSRDTRVLIEVKDPFRDPRYSPISFCERGAYIAEIMGAKDHLVVPTSILRQVIDGKELEAKQWPYTYHQRLVAHPESSGGSFNQLARAIELVAQIPYTRRAVCTTAVPNLDPFLTEDIPCLRELQLRCVENEDGSLNLNATTMWRSRDLYKAWGDNVIAITFWLQIVAQEIAAISGRPVKLGSYADFSCSLHIYGQDFGLVGGDQAKGLASFFDAFPTDEAFINRSLASEVARDLEVIPQLEELLTPEKITEWRFPPEEQNTIKTIIDRLKTGQLRA